MAPATAAELQAFAAQVRQAEIDRPGVPLTGIDVPLKLRLNGNSPYLMITAEIRRHLDGQGADYDLTCRHDLDNGLVTWDLALHSVQPTALRKLLDWLVPVYTYER